MRIILRKIKLFKSKTIKQAMSTEKLKYKPDENNNLQELAPEFSKIKKENSFKVPDGYFDSLPMKIQEKVSEPKTISIWEQLSIIIRQPKYSVSFVFATTLIIVPLIIFIKPEVQQSLYLSDITIEDVLRGNPELIYNLDESDIIEIMLAEVSKDDPDYIDNNVKSDSSITDEDIINYLSDENFETELLYNL